MFQYLLEPRFLLDSQPVPQDFKIDKHLSLLFYISFAFLRTDTIIRVKIINVDYS